MTIPAHMQFSTLTLEDALSMFGDQLPEGWSWRLEAVCNRLREENEKLERLQWEVGDLESDVDSLVEFRNQTENYLDGITQTDDPLTIKRELLEIIEMYGYL